MKQILAIARKELDGYFGSPMALIFVGVFLVVTYFTFFWVNAFFARGIADVRPLFQWMPLLMIFLIAALTMRQWSEEQSNGTLEILMTMPVKLTQLVLGKFLAVMALVAVALLMTISLPLTAALLGQLDPGPVIGGYLAAVLLAAAYAAIGLFVSSRTDNQLVALILTVIVCGLFYLVGSTTLTGLATVSMGQFMRALGTGSRFESIERGVIDIRDLVYYASLTIIFLALNVVALESKRWGIGKALQNNRRNRRLGTALIIFNLIAFNLLIGRVDGVRADLTQGAQYTLSPVTRDLLASLREPLVVHGYFSAETHPLLSPLIPQVQDMLREYQAASGGRMQLDIVDPLTDPQVEEKVTQTYGIQPTPLQVSNRGGTSLVNSYFDILIQYGDQSSTLNLLDLIDVTNTGGGTPDVRLRNLEYDLTSTIQHAVYGFQSIDAVLASLEQPAQLTLYVTPDTLPDEIKGAPDTINSVVADIQKQAGDKLQFQTVDVSNSNVSVAELADKYAIRPVAASFLSQDSFYLHLLLQIGDKFQVIYPSGQLSENDIRQSIESALKRLAPGFLQVIGVWTPPDPGAAYGQPTTLQQYNTALRALGDNYEVRTLDLSSGVIASDVNAVLLIGPQNLTDTQRYAIDQYLMRGGSVMIAAGSFQMTLDQQAGNLAVQPISEGLADMLKSYGITVEPQLVLDTQNASFPITVARNVGGFTVNEIQALPYPQFVDVRQDAMLQNSPITAGLSSVVLNWASPITLDAEANAARTVSTLLQSSSSSWITTDSAIEPNLALYPDYGFPVGSEQKSYPLAVAVTGSFTSYFKDRTLPLTQADTASDAMGDSSATADSGAAQTDPTGFVATSPDSARLVVVGSSEFLNDNLFQLASRMGQDRSASNVQFVQNAVDWFAQDTGLSTIRARGASSHLLRPLEPEEQSRWEIFNYAFTLILLVGLGVVWQLRKRGEKPIPLLPDERTTDAALTAQSMHGGR